MDAISASILISMLLCCRARLTVIKSRRAVNKHRKRIKVQLWWQTRRRVITFKAHWLRCCVEACKHIAQDIINPNTAPIAFEADMRKWKMIQFHSRTNLHSNSPHWLIALGEHKIFASISLRAENGQKHFFRCRLARLLSIMFWQIEQCCWLELN